MDATWVLLTSRAGLHPDGSVPPEKHAKDQHGKKVGQGHGRTPGSLRHHRR